ncbi:haloacid dehalogenase type II [Wenyingzhuangia aestuarii]|uniref:haloacid dehalogenase type II n=1 Tax=Wenyingzhuangia aestuarii TaxID=1647582 RepID=UPI00143C24F8|nr:haloacid dehalogenase type II [Wenyingzhuangia aestuarii]NJB81363.1 2-haloacid dehalogenase [Wenyingzhuangia aestuarii]
MQHSQRPKVLFFDVNESLLDLSSMKKHVGKALNGREDLLPLWFSTMLHYSLVTTASKQFTDFSNIGAAALQMVAKNHNINLSTEETREVLKNFSNLLPHPEAIEALRLLKKAGYIMIALSNSSIKGMRSQFKNAGLTHLFEQQLSVEEFGKYKPETEVYYWAAKKLKAEPKDCMLIAAHGWDVAGAMWAGFRAAFINRPGQQLYPLAPMPEISETDLLKIAKKLIAL